MIPKCDPVDKPQKQTQEGAGRNPTPVGHALSSVAEVSASLRPLCPRRAPSRPSQRVAVGRASPALMDWREHVGLLFIQILSSQMQY